jgi:hypothetical protein
MPWGLDNDELGTLYALRSSGYLLPILGASPSGIPPSPAN